MIVAEFDVVESKYVHAFIHVSNDVAYWCCINEVENDVAYWCCINEVENNDVALGTTCI
jgi:hypothetical protein